MPSSANNDGLKCPFCGKYSYYLHLDEKRHVAGCVKCGLQLTARTKKDVVHRWHQWYTAQALLELTDYASILWWVRCADKMPADSEPVLAFDGARGVGLCSYHHLYNDGTPHPDPWWRWRDMGDSRANNVTHWAPLPNIIKVNYDTIDSVKTLVEQLKDLVNTDGLL